MSFTQGQQSAPVPDTPEEIRALFRLCDSKQKTVERRGPQRVRDFFRRELLSAQPFFPTAPNLDAIDLLVWKGHLYEALVGLLKAVGNDEVKFGYVLAQWLGSEKIPLPQNLFSPEVFRRMTAGLSVSDFYNANLVRIWSPYTEPLVRKAKWLRQAKGNLRTVLESLGYESGAVNLVSSRSWGSAVEFTCEWLAGRESSGGRRYERETLRNSYSRSMGQVRFSLSKCSFCDKPSKTEFWVHGAPVITCNSHRGDRLPISEESPWIDHMGRRWWRDNLEIRSSIPGAPI